MTKTLLLSIIIAVFASALSIILRWMQAGDGPFMTMYDVLLSNMFSLGFLFLLFYLIIPLVRPASLFVLPLLSLLGLWAITTDMAPTALPATFDTFWLWIHVGVGKVFLGLSLTTAGLAAVLLMRYSFRLDGFKQLPDSTALDDMAWRFMAVSFVFHSLMLISGAVWSQDAWGTILGMGFAGNLVIYHLAGTGFRAACPRYLEACRLGRLVDYNCRFHAGNINLSWRTI